MVGGEPLDHVDLGADPDDAPLGAASTHSRMRSVEPTRSAIATTAWEHSGCTITSPSGCAARDASTWAGWKR